MVEADSTGVETTQSQPETVSELELKIIKQIEYYFGDINLGKDKFLQEQIKLDDGWVPLETMIKFERLARLSKDPSVIAKALTKSTEKLVEVSEDNSKIRRSPVKPIIEINEEKRKEMMKRTLYCKGFAKEGTTIDNLLEFFPQFGEIDHIVMRKYKDKATGAWCFKGSVFVVFSNIEDAKSLLEKSEVKYQDVELIKKWQNDYIEDKRKEKLSKVKSSKKNTTNEEVEGEEEDKGNKEEKAEKEFPKGSVVHLKNLGETNITREDIKAAIEKSGVRVAFVNFKEGDSEATIRLDSEGAALELAGKVKEGMLEIKENIKAEMRVLEGEEEETFLAKALEDKKKLQKSRHNRGFKGRGFGRGKKRKHGHHDFGSRKSARLD